jgi:uncharacterized membrane protein
MNYIKDAPARSLVKGITWRIIGTIDTFILAYFFFGKINLALPIAITEVFTKILLYFLHERGWNLIKWGRGRQHISHFRSLIKGVSWRLFGSIDTVVISWIYSGNPLGALKVGATELLTKVFLFYLHERIWTAISWGRIHPQDIPVET